MWSTASKGFHSEEPSSHILTRQGRSFVNEIEGRLGMLCFEKWNILPFTSSMHLSGSGVDTAGAGGCLIGSAAEGGGTLMTAVAVDRVAVVADGETVVADRERAAVEGATTAPAAVLVSTLILSLSN